MTHFDSDQLQSVRKRNKQPNRTKMLLVIALLFTVGGLCFIHQNWPDQSVHLTFCDVGQGDAILIHRGFFQVLIDSSQDDRVLDCLGRFLPFWDRDLEVVIITHYHRDHVGGLESVLAIYHVQTLLTAEPPPGFSEKTPTLMTQLAAALEQGTDWKRPFLGQTIRFDSSLVPMTLEVLQALPGKNQADEKWLENDRSIVTLLTVGGVKALFTGDLEAAGERLLVASGQLSPVDILKVGHHGSKTSTTPDLLERIRPKVAIISAGKRNSYGHPAPVTLANLAKWRVKVLTTADIGNIDIVTDGKTYWQHPLHY